MPGLEVHLPGSCLQRREKLQSEHCGRMATGYDTAISAGKRSCHLQKGSGSLCSLRGYSYCSEAASGVLGTLLACLWPAKVHFLQPSDLKISLFD